MRYIVSCSESVFPEMTRPKRWVYHIGLTNGFEFTYNIFVAALYEESLARDVLEDVRSYLKRKGSTDSRRPPKLISEDELITMYIMGL